MKILTQQADNMKVVILIVISIVIFGCSSSRVLKEESLNIVNEFSSSQQLENGSYFVEYSGSNHTSIEEARSIWHEKASETCLGNNYDYKILNESMWETDIEIDNNMPSQSDRELAGSYGVTGSLCATGGAIGCMLASIFQSKAESKAERQSTASTEKVRFPVIEGNVSCHS